MPIWHSFQALKVVNFKHQNQHSSLCFFFPHRKLDIVRLGEYDKETEDDVMPNGKKVKHVDLGVKKFLIHPQYKQYVSYHDIALIK